jgi:steroid delta-isomerase-like uncharacterized protein
MGRSIPNFLAAIALGCAANQAQPTATESPAMPDRTERNRSLIRDLYDQRINTGRLERLDEIVSESYVGPQGEKGPAGFARTIELLRTGVPDIHFTVEEILADGDGVAIRWSWRGTHTGPLRQFPASHKPVETTGISMYHFDGDKIDRAVVQTDRLGLLQQIGVVPVL